MRAPLTCLYFIKNVVLARKANASDQYMAIRRGSLFHSPFSSDSILSPLFPVLFSDKSHNGAHFE